MIKSTLVNAAQLSRALNISASYVVALRASGLPFVRTPNGDRYDLAACSRWYCDTIKNKRNDRPMSDDDADAEAVTRLEAIVYAAIREHLTVMQFDAGIARLAHLLTRCGLTTKTAYIVVQAVRLWVGTSSGGEACVVINTPTGKAEISWQKEFIGIARAAISAKCR